MSRYAAAFRSVWHWPSLELTFELSSAVEEDHSANHSVPGQPQQYTELILSQHLPDIKFGLDLLTQFDPEFVIMQTYYYVHNISVCVNMG